MIKNHEYDTFMQWEEATLRLLIALVLGSFVGFERQLHQRTAGLRTNMLVSLGSAAFTLFGATLVESQSVARIVAQIVSGIGFLGAGAIMREGLNVHGLNTAATLWCSGALGVFCGVGLHLSAFIFCLFIVMINTFLRRLENYMEANATAIIDAEVSYSMEIVCSQNNANHIHESLLKRMRHKHFFLKQMQTKILENDLVQLHAIFKTKGVRDQNIGQVMEDLSMDADIHFMEWHIINSAEK